MRSCLCVKSKLFSLILYSVRAYSIIVLSLLFFCQQANAQLIVKGKVTDAATNDPVPFANVGIKGSALGTTTDFEGKYSLLLKSAGDSLLVSYLGYKPKAKFIDRTQSSLIIDFQIEASANSLAEVVIRAGENPAWPLLRKIVKNKEKNDRKKLIAYEYDSYNRVELSLDKISEKMQQRKLMKRIGEAISESKKAVGEDGKLVLPVFVSETVSKFYFKDSPRKTKEIIVNSRVKGIGLADESVLNELLGASFQDFNFYRNWVRLVGKDFHSPVADGWRATYDYYLADTTLVGLNTCFGIEFEPKNKLDLAFTGKMWIDTTSFAIAQIDVTVGKEANLNFVEKIKINQEFEPVDSSSAWLPAATRLLVDISELKKNTNGLLAKIYSRNQNFVVNKPRPSNFYDQTFERQEDASNPNEDFWQQKRPQPLTKSEQRVYQLIDSIKQVPIVRTYTTLTRMALSAHIPVSDRLELGPFPNVVAVNSVEGLRLQMGFRTRESFSKRLLMKGFVADGTKDNRWKYGLDVQYTISRKPWVQLGAHVGYDVERLGVNAAQLGGNAISNQLFATFARFGIFERAFLQHEQTASIAHEIMPGLTHNFAYSHRTFTPLFSFKYRTKPDLGDNSPQSREYNVDEFRYEIRFAKGEVLIRNNNRRPLRLRKARDWPIMTFRYTGGVGGSPTRHFNYHRFNLQIDKSFRVGILGRANTEMQVGFSPSTIPYPLLFNHQGNPSPIFIANAYNTMQFFEFTSDRFISASVFHDFEGFLTNRIPLFRRLKWRSHVLGKVLWGATQDANERIIPRFDQDGKRVLPINRLNAKMPYIEVGYGLDNIFKFLRVDAIHRLTYRDSPDAQKFVLKAAFAFKL
ncbi:MAG: carboxypeptidase-like regulatory domain-containing protein [Runella slithyformis]|nr:MAG: carboxypeptidase-like regulatory domain-containing protein [Runella slithyformis]TAE98719.1 MAG: carboxypeptidase-like regulatory domain-containing protein [Runella slithyformis]TAF80954.1 MAG: carboxypeptidase-like regulatory domain-containing protein [Runella slithyformis]